MNKICTSIEQSQKLIELGIDVNTADMDYIQFANDPKVYDCAINIYNNEHEDNWIPAWSLSALLELIPPYLGEFSEGIDFEFSKSMNGKWYSARYFHLNDDKAITFNKVVTGDTAIDATFEMVVWLKENNKI